MILRIRNSRTFKGICVTLALSIFFEIISPVQALALTGGPAQPEFSSFTPIGASDMVDLSSGDMSYNIPLMDVGGYPINLAYSGNVGMDDEASWVGLGWNLSVGQVSRNVRGIPDDFKGDKIEYEDHQKKNITIGTNFKFKPHITGVDIINASAGMAITYNNYTGLAIKQSAGITLDLGKFVSVGANVDSGPDGLCISPSASLHTSNATQADRDKMLSGSVGLSYNSRQGLSAMTLNVSKANSVASKKTESGKASRSRSLGSAISFADQSYTPTKRVGMSTKSFTFNAALGAEVFGGEGQGQISGYGTIMKVKDKFRSLGAYGYAHSDLGGTESVLDFNREKDGNFSINTTNLPITNYTYDIYSVQGQGVGGMYRPYRNQVGYVYDGRVTDESLSGDLGVEIGTGNAFHAGLDFEMNSTDSRSGLWEQNNYILNQLKETYNYNPRYEKVHYKNVGDLSVDRDFGMYTGVGNYNAVRVQYGGGEFNRKANSTLNKKVNWQGGETPIAYPNAVKRSARQLRNQAINNLTVAQVQAGAGYGPVAYGETSIYGGAKAHHTGEVQIIRNDGARYIYGLPAYNKTKREATFSVNGSPDCNSGLVDYTHGQLASPTTLPHDQYLSRVTTPAYAHSYLLTSILSTDYQDIDDNGPTVNDLGSYTKFTYDKKADYKWRVPFTRGESNYNEGLRTNEKDDQGNYVYGEKEMFYIKTIQTKTHIAVFYTSPRKDAYGVSEEQGSPNNQPTSSVSYQLDKVELYSVGEYFDETGAVVPGAKPIKTAHFVYDYALCKGVPNNILGSAYGKLTLQKVYFEYRDSKMGKYTAYSFDYDEGTTQNNPNYNLKGYDCWGNYKPNLGTCFGDTPTAAEFPYTSQNATEQNVFAAAWLLRSIELPSGGKITVSYESDNYSYVQNREVNRMFKVRGAGTTTTPPGSGSTYGELFSQAPNVHRRYLFVEVDPDAVNEAPGVLYNKYLKGLNNLIQFRFLLNMTQQGSSSTSTKFDYVSGYAQYDPEYQSDLKIVSGYGTKILVLPVLLVEKEGGIAGQGKVNPIAKAGWQFGRKFLSNHVYSNQPNGDSEDIAAIIPELVGNITNLIEIFSGPNGALENRNIARRFHANKSFVRLREPDGTKLGGGARVKEVRTVDNWEQMTDASGYFTMEYGQQYAYTYANGKSSGVATYEPIGNKENPFVEPVFSTVEHILAPNEENFVEKPFGESFFPSPTVTYARVEVASLQLGDAPAGLSNAAVKKLHRTGKVVTEYYTSKDFPTIVDQTKLDAVEDESNALGSLLNLTMKKHMTASQGYVIHLNDMNGKQKAQWVYAQGQTAPISGVEYNYSLNPTDPGYSASSTGTMNQGRLNNKVRVINANGSIEYKTIGVEVDVVNDFRENKTITEVYGTNTNLAAFLVGIIPILVPIPLPDYSKTEDQFRSVSTTKVINSFGLLSETIAHDAGAAVYTKNLAWDANTGEVLITETIDEFNDRYYTLNYPAHWYYKGMAQAANNLGLSGTLAPSGGNYVMQNLGGYTSSHFLINGDEVFINNGIHAWVTDLVGNQFKLIDAAGNPVTGLSSGAGFVVIRSGHRNLQSAGIMNVTLKHNPLKDESGNMLNSLGGSYLNTALSGDYWKVINAGAVDYSDTWKVGCECDLDLLSGTYNPYLYNERGVWRTKSSRTYLAGRDYQQEITPRMDGYFSSFSPMYRLVGGGHWVQDLSNWTFVAEVSKYSPYGFELENMDALTRYSAAQYGYNHTFPMAVGANTEYRQIGYDGFEDYGFDGCTENTHFNFIEEVNPDLDISKTQAHTGKHSLKVAGASMVSLSKKLSCGTAQP